MSSAVARSTSQSQVPPEGSLNLDHVASFVPDRESCERALAALGFASAPFSLQYHRLSPDGDLVPAGTGNHCVMLQAGYLEYLVPVADTSVASQLRGSIARYVGAHSIVFGTGAATADHARLVRQGFDPLVPIALQRDVDTSEGRATARFTVVRVPPDAMAEGRIQFCQHHTEACVWQGRWLDHPNGAVALNGVIVCVADPGPSAERYERFTGIAAQRIDDESWLLQLQRGRLELYSPAALHRRYGVVAPALPWIAGCEVATRSLAAARDGWSRHGVDWRALGDSKLLVTAPAAVGGVLVFVDA
jgi:hypothetical protein